MGSTISYPSESKAKNRHERNSRDRKINMSTHNHVFCMYGAYACAQVNMCKYVEALTTH